MSRTPFEVRPLDLSDSTLLNDAAAVATRAFQFDPFFVHLSPRPLLRARGLGLFVRATLAALGDAAECYGAFLPDGRLVGVGAWIKPGRYPLPALAQARQLTGSFWALFPRPAALLDGVRYIAAMDKAHPHGPVWYLNLLVADPSVQRAGIGGALQEQVLPRADAEGLDCYLETQNPDNLAYYRRFGWEVVDELRPVRNGPPLWALSRSPRG